MNIISKEESQVLGLKRYFTGIPCSKGHIAERTTLRNDCVECLYIRQRKWEDKNREKLNQKSNEWYHANKDFAKQVRKNWRDKNPDRVKENVAKYQATHQEKLKITNAAWRKRNTEKVNAYAKAWREKNPQTVLEKSRQYRKDNPDKINALKAKRMAAKVRATPKWANMKEIGKIYKAAIELKKITNMDYHVDHIVPLRSKLVCGLHCEDNLRVIPGIENQKKSNRYWPDMP